MCAPRCAEQDRHKVCDPETNRRKSQYHNRPGLNRYCKRDTQGHERSADPEYDHRAQAGDEHVTKKSSASHRQRKGPERNRCSRYRNARYAASINRTPVEKDTFAEERKKCETSQTNQFRIRPEESGRFRSAAGSIRQQAAKGRKCKQEKQRCHRQHEKRGWDSMIHGKTEQKRRAQSAKAPKRLKGRHDRPRDFVLYSDGLGVDRYIDRTFYRSEKYRRCDQDRVTGRKSRQCQGGAESKHGRESDRTASPLGDKVAGCGHRDQGTENQPKENPAQLPVRKTEAFLKIGYQRGPCSKGHPIYQKERRGRPPRFAATARLI